MVALPGMVFCQYTHAPRICASLTPKLHECVRNIDRDTSSAAPLLLHLQLYFFRRSFSLSVLWLCYKVMLPDWYSSLSLGADFTASADKQNSGFIWKGKQKPNMVSTDEFWGSRGTEVVLFLLNSCVGDNNSRIHPLKGSHKSALHSQWAGEYLEEKSMFWGKEWKTAKQWRPKIALLTITFYSAGFAIL